MIVLNVIFVIVLAVCIFIGIRNQLTYRFRSGLIEIVFAGDNWVKKHNIFHNGPSYNQMLLSFKPLKLESFYTPEQIEELNK